MQLLTAVACASRVHGIVNRLRTKEACPNNILIRENHADFDGSQTYHSAVGHGTLGFAGTFGALPPLRVSVGRLADLEDVPG